MNEMKLMLLGKKRKRDGKQWQQKIEKLLPKYIINHRNNFFSLPLCIIVLVATTTVSFSCFLTFFLLFSFTWLMQAKKNENSKNKNIKKVNFSAVLIKICFLKGTWKECKRNF